MSVHCGIQAKKAKLYRKFKTAGNNNYYEGFCKIKTKLVEAYPFYVKSIEIKHNNEPPNLWTFINNKTEHLEYQEK